MKLKNIDYMILSELIKNSKTSDRKLAKIVEVSQPTVTRRRINLEKEGLLEYTIIPNFENACIQPNPKTLFGLKSILYDRQDS